MALRTRCPFVTKALFSWRAPWIAFLLGPLSACTTPHHAANPMLTPHRLETLLPTPVLLLGEQHEAPGQPQLQQAVTQHLAAKEALAALLLEMADRGRDTRHLPPHASEIEVQTALGWSRSWPWERYGPTVMTAVRAGVPVFGANLPRQAMGASMKDGTLDATLDTVSLAKQRDNIRHGHCGLLPEHQIPGMARIQIARDRSMADAIMASWLPHKTVVLLAGNEHVRSDLGIPRHLSTMATPWSTTAGPVRVVRMQARSADAPTSPAGTRSNVSDTLWETPSYPERDHCAELRQQWQQR